MYPISHGEAVYWGIQLLFHIFKREDLIKECDDIMRELNLSFGNPPWGPSLKDPSSFVNDLMDFAKGIKKLLVKKKLNWFLSMKKEFLYLFVCDFETVKSKLDSFFQGE